MSWESPRCSPLFQDTRLIENAKFMQISTKIQMCIIWVTFVGLGAAENSQAGGLTFGKFMQCHLQFITYAL